MGFERRWVAFLQGIGAFVLLALVSGCGGDSREVTGPTVAAADMVDEGSWYAKESFPHDGAPYESEHFTVFSDSAGLEARQRVADIAESLYSELIDEFGITEDLLVFPSDQDKIHVMAFRDQNPQDRWEARAYYAGLIVMSLDHEEHTRDIDSYTSVVRHELTHVLESLLKGEAAAQEHHTEVWFSEGLAEAMTGGTTAYPIKDLNQLNELRDLHPGLNPIAMRYDDLAVDADTYRSFLYPTFQLAVEYLLDEGGLAKTPGDAADMYLDMGAGAYFSQAFEDNFGISVNEFRDEFFDRMAEHLPERYGSIAFTSFGLILISLIAIGIAVTSSIWSARSTAAAIAVAPEAAAPARGSRIGFAAWIVVVVALSFLLFLRGVFQVGGARTIDDGDKIFGLTALIAYLGVSAFLLTWAVRRRLQHSGAAWLIPLLAIGATGITNVIVGSII